MLSKDFVKLCVDSTNEAIKEMGLPRYPNLLFLNEILKEKNYLFQQELKNKNICIDDFTKPEVFDLYSYSIFKVISRYLKEDEEKLKFTQIIGKKIYSWIKNQKKLERNGPDDISKIKYSLEQIIKFFEEVGYVSSAKIDWKFFNEDLWRKRGESYLVYVMNNPVILPSAQRLYREENFGQHYSTRTLEAALSDFGIIGREVEDFDPTKFDSYAEELWRLRKK